MGEMQGGGESRFDAYGGTAEFQPILGIAEALRTEFGIGIDAHPGGEGSEAGVVNRAFRAAAGSFPGRCFGRGRPHRRPEMGLRQVALQRLDELGVDSGLAEAFLDLEPDLDDRWLTYLALAPASVVGDLLAGPAGK